MQNLLWLGRCFFGIGIIGIGVQQFIYSAFRPFLLEYWSPTFPGLSTWAYIAGAILIIAGILIIFGKNGRNVSLGLAIFFLLLFICFHVYYQLFLSPNDFSLGAWTNPLKELAFAGGALIIAVSFSGRSSATDRSLLLLGRIFFSIMLIAFGIDHFLYKEFVATIVPNCIPGHMFWTYFAGTALIGSGICIMFRIMIHKISILLGLMLFIWFVILHIPRAIADPNGAKGNEITSVFQ